MKMKSIFQKGICMLLATALFASTFTVLSHVTPVKADEVDINGEYLDDDWEDDEAEYDEEEDVEETETTCTITFDGSGATGGKMNSVTATCGEDFTFPKNSFTKKGSKFTGWEIDDETYQVGATVDPAIWESEEVTVYACWTPITYKISYKLKGGKNASYNPTSYTYSADGRTLSLYDPTRSGYAFEGWYADASYKKRVKTINTKNTKNIILYAKWKKDKYAAYKELLNTKYKSDYVLFHMVDVNGDNVKELFIADYRKASSYDWDYCIYTLKNGKISDSVSDMARGTLKYNKDAKCVIFYDIDSGSLSATGSGAYSNCYKIVSGKFKYTGSKLPNGKNVTVEPKYKVTDANIKKYCK